MSEEYHEKKRLAEKSAGQFGQSFIDNRVEVRDEPQIPVEIGQLAKSFEMLEDQIDELLTRIQPVTGTTAVPEEKAQDRDLVPLAGTVWNFRVRTERIISRLSRILEALEL